MNDNQALQQAVTALRDGGVVLHATEGVWGFACDPFKDAAVQKVLDLKQRPKEKGLLVIAADAGVFNQELAAQTNALAERARKSWPGAHTWVLPNHRFSDYVTGEHHSIACRVPGHAQARSLCALFGGPLVSTSANLAGEPAIVSEGDAAAQFGDKVDYLLSGVVNNPGAASRIYDLAGESLRI